MPLRNLFITLLLAVAPLAAVEPAYAPTAAEAPAIADLRADLEQLIREPGWRGAQWSVLVTSLDHRDTLYAHAPQLSLAPASNLKLFTSAAALYYLGPEFRFSTYLLATGDVRDGVLQGDVVLYGTGDPAISRRLPGSRLTVWEAFADSLAALGVREVHGAVVGDGSYFAGSGSGRGWQESYVNASYAAPAGALSVGENLVTLRITPTAAGQPPGVEAVPGGVGLAIVNEARTVTRGATRIQASRSGYDGPIVVRGEIRAGRGSVQRTLPVADPARYAALTFRETLEERGIRVTGGVRSVESAEESGVTGRTVFAPAFDRGPHLRVLAVHRSPRLLEILEVVNKKSHNMYAEQVLRAVGRVAVNEGTAEGGARAVRHFIAAETPADTQSLHMFDGSGLSVLNRVSAGTTIGLLEYVARSSLWEPLWHTLPEAASSDGLRRMQRTAAAGNLRAKTGTIEHVSALSGYVRAADGERLAFSIISNGVPSTWRAKRIEDAIGARLASFSRNGTGAGGTPAAAAATPTRAPPASPRVTASTARTHTIRRGDTLEAIAKQYGVSVQQLRAANPGVSPRRLIPGKKLRLP